MFVKGSERAIHARKHASNICKLLWKTGDHFLNDN